MTELFNMDNLFFRFMTKVCYVFFLSVLWLIASLPIVTMGAATVALHRVMLQLVRDEEGYLLHTFCQSFIKDLKKSTGIGLLLMGSFIILIADLAFFMKMGNTVGHIVTMVFTGMLFILSLMTMLIFHHMAWFDGSLKETLKSTLGMALAYMPYSVALLILAACMLYAIYVSVPMMIFLAFFGMGIFSYISAYLWRNVFDKIEKIGG